MKKVNYYFEVAKEAKLAVDQEGNPAPAQCHINIELVDSATAEDIAKMGEFLKNKFATDMGIPSEYFKDITKEEYEEFEGDVEDAESLNMA